MILAAKLKRTAQRNSDILAEYESGITKAELAAMYQLAIGTVAQIIVDQRVKRNIGLAYRCDRVEPIHNQGWTWRLR
jgi:hypothetical protein